MAKIYTKKGDQGKTALFNGDLVWKDNLRVSAYGSLDELNSFLGVVCAFLEEEKVREKVREIQSDLMSISSVLASPDSSTQLVNLLSRTSELETWIDQMSEILPPLKNFVIPGGSKGGSLLQLGRTICRRAEREVVKLSQKEKIPAEILVYLNRLSDLLFTLAFSSLA